MTQDLNSSKNHMRNVDYGSMEGHQWTVYAASHKSPIRVFDNSGRCFSCKLLFLYKSYFLWCWCRLSLSGFSPNGLMAKMILNEKAQHEHRVGDNLSLDGMGRTKKAPLNGETLQQHESQAVTVCIQIFLKEIKTFILWFAGFLQ